MKSIYRLLCVTLSILGVIVVLGNHSVEASAKSKPIFIAVNDEMVEFPDSQPEVRNSTTYVPVRFITYAIEGEIVRDSKENTVLITKGNKTAFIRVNEKTVEVETGEKREFDIFWKDNRIMVPLRFIGEHFGYDISYIPQGPIARIADDNASLMNEEVFSHNKDIIVNTKKKWAEENKPKKKVYLTFDDGPNQHTTAILNVLKEKEAKATFFMMEWSMHYYDDTVKRIVKEGHYPASHSITHDVKKVYKSPSSLVYEMNTNRKTIKKITDVSSNLIRTPYGSHPYVEKVYRDALVKNKFKMWDWNVDSLDWRYQNNPTQILHSVKRQVDVLDKKGVEPVIVFHDKYGTAKILPQIIDYLHAKGYECVAYNPEEHFTMNFWNDERL